jgi:hypothetical protein
LIPGWYKRVSLLHGEQTGDVPKLLGAIPPLLHNVRLHKGLAKHKESVDLSEITEEIDGI